ncbi:hypothetical protein CS0771_13590 [Catellatospora sp. IY07-71]|uniref:TadE/TadG family type IV pilus assembly protein n=1 Tax=Catellatospora sp. IY07-71 TaxID=2728827 RepID=UPI001BB3B3E1|nr:TadE/TadG family type IV pilus assembly protein [Catellatospora sp. IY07-71]BCJ71815.1 hypothetical protein CS0771_13590 [Catellatospora sp. IY07-71]
MNERADRGAAAVEMAFVLPLLLLLVLGIIDFGRMLNAQISVTEAAREGARAATISSVAGAAQTRVNKVNTDYTVDTGASTFCPASPTAGSDATVVVTYTFEWITPVGGIASMFGGASFGDDITITGKGVMPCRA